MEGRKVKWLPHEYSIVEYLVNFAFACVFAYEQNRVIIEINSTYDGKIKK
jgi:hypothetical protein